MQPDQKPNSRVDNPHQAESDVDVDIVDYDADDSDAESIDSVEHNHSPLPTADNDPTLAQPSAASEQTSSDDEPQSPVKIIGKKRSRKSFERESCPSPPTHEQILAGGRGPESSVTGPPEKRQRIERSMGVRRPWHRRRWARGQQGPSSRATHTTFITSSVSSEAGTASTLDYSASQMYVTTVAPRLPLTVGHSFGNPALYANELNASRTPLRPIQRSVLFPPFSLPS